MDEKKGILIFKEKQIKILLALLKQDRRWYITDIAKFSGVTYVHTSRFITACEKVGIIGSERHGRIKAIFLTEKGKKITEQIQFIIDTIKLSEIEKLKKEKIILPPE